MTAILIGAVFLALGLGVPIFIALALPSAFVIMSDPMIDNVAIAQRMFFSLDRFPLMAIPYFMFCAEIMNRGLIGKKLVNLCRAFCGHLPGGMAIATVVACLIFGAISGAGAAALVAFGALMFTMMKEGNYTEDFSIGLISASSTLAMLIPPSIAYVVFATITGDSIATLFVSGLGAGILFGVALIMYSVVYAIKKKLPTLEKATWRERWKTLKDSIISLNLIVIILGGIYGGVLTVTEAAGIAAFYAIVVECFIYRELKLKDMFKVAVDAGKMIAMLMILIAAGSVLSWILTIYRVPQQVVSLLGDVSGIAVLLIINVIFLVAGMFMDPTSAKIILVPLLYPAAMAVGINPIHMATIIVINLAIGMLSPPFGLNLFVGATVFKKSYSEIVGGVLPFVAISILVLLTFTFIPELSTWLPRQLGLMR